MHFSRKKISLPPDIKDKIMTQLVITLRDKSYLSNIRRIVKSLQGVESVSVARQKRVTGKAKKVSSASVHSGSAIFLKGLVAPVDTSQRQLVEEYLEEKYGL